MKVNKYNINILSTNTLLHLDRNFTIIKATDSAIGYFSAKAFGNTISQCSVTVSRDNLQFMATGNKLVLYCARMQTGVPEYDYLAIDCLLAGAVRICARNEQRILILE